MSIDEKNRQGHDFIVCLCSKTDRRIWYPLKNKLSSQSLSGFYLSCGIAAHCIFLLLLYIVSCFNFIMYAIKGHFDGKQIRLLESIPIKGEADVIITILEPEDELVELLKLSESSLDFWDNEIDDQAWNEA